MVAAEEFGVPLEKVTVVLGDIDTSPKSGPTVASRITYVCGNAFLLAASALKDRILNVATRVLGEAKETLTFSKEMISCSSNPSKKIPLAQIANECYVQGINLRQDSWFKAKHAMIGHTFCATIADVQINTVTGQVSLSKMINVHDVGRAIHPMGVVSQLDGAALQSLGWALMEDFTTEKGYVKTPSLTEYLIPTSKDIPSMMPSIYIETPYPTGPYGAKGVGEHAMMTAPAAIVNAIHCATGIILTELPVIAETLL